MEEAKSLWPDAEDSDADDRVKCIVSIGTGRSQMKNFGKNFMEIARTLIAISTETENTAETFAKSVSGPGRLKKSILYYRFNVSRGLETVGLDDYQEKPTIVSATKSYLATVETCKRIESCTAALRFRDGHIRT